ncbi:LlaJI family restriction endonuclease [Mesomycoplasma ovipneumoniae]|uniref:LlaJI family restriction endonuclease n=1 Tax=Mesomycoplasma ovipneumoniae TaxID=29562 RepID=UPI00311B0E04
MISMISRFVREQIRYTQRELCSILKCNEDEAVILIRKLKEYGVLKAVKASDKQKNMNELLDEDIEISGVEVGKNEYFYVFTFVGVIVIAGRVLKCYPKYLLSNKNPTNELKQIIKVLEKYNSSEQIIKMFNDSSESSSFNLLTVILFLLNDYYENGIYKSTEEIVEFNGTGEILWDKTINESFAILSNEKPYYMELHTRKRLTNEFDYFTRLHQCILTKISKELKNANLLDLFEITEVDLSDEKLYDFGDEDYILYRIEKELAVQYNTRKQLLLMTIYSYIDKKGSLDDLDCLSLFGTNNFNLVWEKICAHIMNNQLENSLGALNLPVLLKDGYDKKKKLIDLIEKPLWTITGKEAKNTLIPDLVSIFQNNGNYEFIIFDAKYYNAHLEYGITPSGQPGIESITKQYLYQLAYQKFINDHEFSAVKNCFLLPSENDSIENKGEVKLEMMENIGLQNVQVRFIPAVMAYDLYLTERKMDFNLLNL